MAKATKKKPAPKKPRAKRPPKLKQQFLPTMEPPRNDKIEKLIDRWHEAKGGFKEAGTEFSGAATLLGAAMEEEGIDAYQYDGKIVRYERGKKKLKEEPVGEESVNGEA